MFIIPKKEKERTKSSCTHDICSTTTGWAITYGAIDIWGSRWHHRVLGVISFCSSFRVYISINLFIFSISWSRCCDDTSICWTFVDGSRSSKSWIVQGANTYIINLWWAWTTMLLMLPFYSHLASKKVFVHISYYLLSWNNEIYLYKSHTIFYSYMSSYLPHLVTMSS